MSSDKKHVFVFLRRNGAPLPIGCEGHVGWGYQSGPETFVFGGTENTSGNILVPAGEDNGAWIMSGDRQAMLQEMTTKGYDACKELSTAVFDPDAAWQKANWTLGAGYAGWRNNCLDHVIAVLSAYGILGMPSAQSHPSPKDWFGILAGEFHNL